MKAKADFSRRRFFCQAGSLVAAPLAVVTAADSKDVVQGNEALNARLAALEDANAIRELNRTYARLIDAGAHDQIATLFAEPARAEIDERIRSFSADGFGDRDVIEIARDGKTAAARLHCTVRVETPIEPGHTLVEMARQQGEGVLRRSEKRVLENSYVKRGDDWKIERSAYRSA